LLAEVEDDAHLTQRTLAARLGVALGLTNAYLKRCILKGWVKAQEIPSRRYAYYLTPGGFAEKSRLAAQYLTDSFTFFRAAHETCQRSLNACQAAGWKTIALYGDGELGQVASIAAMEMQIPLAGVISPGSNKETVANLPVVQNIEDLAELDAIILTDIRQSQRSYDNLCKIFPPDRIIVPEVLRVTTLNSGTQPGNRREAV
jgi:hypothetical protein